MPDDVAGPDRGGMPGVEDAALGRRNAYGAEAAVVVRHLRSFPVVQPPVLFAVERRQPAGVFGTELAVGQLHRHLVPLAGVSHLAEAAYPDISTGHAGCAQEIPALRFQALERPVYLGPVEFVQAA